MFYTKRDISGPGVLGKPSPELSHRPASYLSGENASHSNFERESRNRKTYVCSQLRLTVGSQHTLIPGKNGLLFHVYPDMVQGRFTVLGKSGQRAATLMRRKTPTSRWVRQILTQNRRSRNASYRRERNA